ncbi:MAG: biotin transporter BioY [Nocardioides sp.]
MTMTEPNALEPTTSGRRRFSPTDLALIASFAALIAVCSYLAAIPVGAAGTPITLQTFAVVLSGLLLGPVRGTLAVGLYLLLGLAGMPVFAEHSSGAGVFTGYTAGYLWTFLLVGFVAGLGALLVGRTLRTRAVVLFAIAMVATVVNHAGGVIGLKLYFDWSWSQAWTADAPFWLGDVVKCAIAAIVAAEVHRAFPRLLGR